MFPKILSVVQINFSKLQKSIEDKIVSVRFQLSVCLYPFTKPVPTLPPLTDCGKDYELRDILLDSIFVESINDQANSAVNLSKINTIVKDSDGWVPARLSDFIDIKLDYAIRLQRVEVVNGSNVRMYSLRMIDENDERKDLEDVTDMLKLLPGDRLIRSIRFFPRRRIDPRIGYEVKLKIYGCVKSEETATTLVIPTTPVRVAECKMVELLDDTKYVSDILISPYVFPEGLLNNGSGVSFPELTNGAVARIELELTKEEDYELLKIEFVDVNTNLDAFDVFVDNRPVLMNVKGLSYLIDDDNKSLFVNAKRIRTDIRSTRDGLAPRNVRLSIKACLRTTMPTTIQGVITTVRQTTISMSSTLLSTTRETIQKTCNMTEMVDRSGQFVSNIEVTPYALPEGLLPGGYGLNFSGDAEEARIRLRFYGDLIGRVNTIEFLDKRTNILVYKIVVNEGMAIDNVTDLSYYIRDDEKSMFNELKSLTIIIKKTSDGKPPRNVILSLKTCDETVTKLTTSTAKTTYPVNTTCEEGAVFTDILLDRNAVEEINDEADRKIDLNTINTAEENSLGWSQDLASDFLDIKLDYAIDVRLIEVVNGSNVRKYSLEMIDEDDDRIKIEV